MSEELRAFWDLVKRDLSNEGLYAVAIKYPELEQEILEIAQKRASDNHMKTLHQLLS